MIEPKNALDVALPPHTVAAVTIEFTQQQRATRVKP